MSASQNDVKEKWLNWLAITTIIMSASATLGSSKSGGYGSTAMMAQNRASDQWAYYQAKSIKQHTFELQRDLLQIQSGQASPAHQAAYQSKIAEYDGTITRYHKERDELQAEAKKIEACRDTASKNGSIFGLSVIFLQIGITLSALAALLKKKMIWVLSLIVGFMGMFYFVNGFLFAHKAATFLIGNL